MAPLKIKDDTSDSDIEERNEEWDDEEDDEEMNCAALNLFKEEMKKKTANLAGDSDDDEVEGSFEEDSDEDDDKGSEVEESDSEDDLVVQQFATIDVSSEIAKGKAVKAQQELWHRMCVIRINLQKILMLANKLPRHDKWPLLVEGNAEEFVDVSRKGCGDVRSLLQQLLHLQGSTSVEGMADGEEQPRESEKRKLEDDFEEVLQKRHKAFIPYRNSVIQKWDEKTRLSSGRMKSFLAFENSAVKQIEQILQDKNRLIRRTQLIRNTEVPVTEKVGENQGAVTHPEMRDLREYDTEIFDDSDFYRQLLKDVIDSKSTDLDPATLRQQMEFQRIRNKMRRKVDTKASKGRKTRYDIVPKLVNIMASNRICIISDVARDNFLKAFFGGAT